VRDGQGRDGVPAEDFFHESVDEGQRRLVGKLGQPAGANDVVELLLRAPLGFGVLRHGHDEAAERRVHLIAIVRKRVVRREERRTLFTPAM
jgi:hypothetical protein